jgi:hypothetical protein
MKKFEYYPSQFTRRVYSTVAIDFVSAHHGAVYATGRPSMYSPIKYHYARRRSVFCHTCILTIVCETENRQYWAQSVIPASLLADFPSARIQDKWCRVPLRDHRIIRKNCDHILAPWKGIEPTTKQLVLAVAPWIRVWNTHLSKPGYVTSYHNLFRALFRIWGKFLQAGHKLI